MYLYLFKKTPQFRKYLIIASFEKTYTISFNGFFFSIYKGFYTSSSVITIKIYNSFNFICYSKNIEIIFQRKN